MKVCMVYLNRLGGILKYASKLADSLASMVELKLFVSSDASAQLLPKKVALTKVKTGRSPLGNLFYTVNPLGYLRIFSEIAIFRPDLIHFPTEHAWNIILQSRLKKYPIVQTIHDPVRHRGEENMFYDLVRHMELVRADRLIVMSRKFQEAFANFGVGPEYVDVIPHGAFKFDDETWPDEAFPSPPLKKNILFAGRINRYKGIDILLKAFTLVFQRQPEATLTIVGKGDISEYKKLLETARNVTVINRYVTERELAEFHAACDFVVAPYIDASQSGVVSLALTNNRAVIATRVGGLPEQVDDGETGLLVEPNNVKQFADAMLLLLGDSEKNLKMASLAKLRYSKQFGWKSIAKKTVCTYTSAFEGHKRRLKANKVPGLSQNIRRGISNYLKEKEILKK